MIPTFNPSPDHLQEAVEGVLDQAGDAEHMQIAIVDDGSAQFDPEAFVRDLGIADRVTWVRAEGEHGIGHNWNRCIELASGQLVHILHQDDRVLPGFYGKLGLAMESGADVGAAFCRCTRVDERGRRTSLMGPACARGVLESWPEDVFVELKIAAPAMVVRRLVYEILGGFDTRRRFVLDWEMWKRIALRYRIWYEPDILIEHRVHRDSATHRLQADAEDMREIRSSIEATQREFGHLLPPGTQVRTRRAYARYGVNSALKLAWHARNFRAARCQLREAARLSSVAEVVRYLCTETVRGLFQRLRSRLRAGT